MSQRISVCNLLFQPLRELSSTHPATLITLLAVHLIHLNLIVNVGVTVCTPKTGKNKFFGSKTINQVLPATSCQIQDNHCVGLSIKLITKVPNVPIFIDHFRSMIDVIPYRVTLLISITKSIVTFSWTLINYQMGFCKATISFNGVMLCNWLRALIVHNEK